VGSQTQAVTEYGMFFDNFIHDYVITLLLFEFPKEKPRENSVISMLNGESLRIYESHKWKSTLYIVKQNQEQKTHHVSVFTCLRHAKLICVFQCGCQLHNGLVAGMLTTRVPDYS
jgi:hypothetical protein